MTARKKMSAGLSVLALGLALAFNTAGSAFAQEKAPPKAEQTEQKADLAKLPDAAKAVLMIDYANFGDTGALLSLIDDHGFNVNLANEDGFTALMSAARSGRTNAALGLIARGADKTMKDNVQHKTAEQWAEATGHPQTAFMIKNFNKAMLDKPKTPKP